MEIWSNKDLCKALNIEDKFDFSASNVSIDSRTIKQGDLFIAIIGDVNDGHKYVKQALENGAVAAIVQFVPDNIESDEKLLIVEDSFKALWKLAEYRRNQINGKVAMITGSVGKTSTKEMIAKALQRQGNVHFTKGNYNNHYGLPLTLAITPKNTDYAVIEVGMNSAGEISPLSMLTMPDVAIITTVEAVHIEFFNSVEEIADAKSEIFDGVNEGTVIINRDNPHYLRMKKNATNRNISNIKTFGKGEGADNVLKEFNSLASHSEIVANINNKEVKISTQLLGEHMALNMVGALSVIDALGCDLEKAVIELEKIQPAKGRGERLSFVINGKKINIIDETYNASPASVKASMKVLGSIKANQDKRVIAILGDMFELGDDSVKMHEELEETIIQNNIDVIVTAGDLMKNLHLKLSNNILKLHCDNSLEIFDKIKDELKEEDVILIKGSRGMKMENFINQLN